MRSIMISIQPQWVEKILNGEKTIEIRKTIPKCKLPCKVYIYCTKQKRESEFLTKSEKFGWIMGRESTFCNRAKEYDANGRVVAEFTLNMITEHKKNFLDFEDNVCYNFKVRDVVSAGFDTDALSLLDFENFIENYGKGKPLYAWHIANLKIYDKPKELNEFYCEKECPYKDWGDVDNIGCWESCCEMFSRGECRFGHLKLKRPPQSWCYVEEMKDE